MKKLSGIIGAIMMFMGIASIPLAYRLAAEYEFGFYLTLILITIQMIPISIGLAMVYTELHFKKSSADDIDKAQPVNIPAPTPTMTRRIEIIINDDGIALSTEGVSPQEIISFLEQTKFYILNKHVRGKSLMDIVSRK